MAPNPIILRYHFGNLVHYSVKAIVERPTCRPVEE